MSDDDDNESSANEVELVDLEWDDALDDWEDELDGSAQAQSAPMPQTSKEAPRPLYRPPSPNDTFAQRPSPQRPPMPPRIDLPTFDDDDEDEAAESTRIAQIPKELIASLVGATERGNERPTRPPPPEKGKPAPVDLDLDGLLDGMAADTRGYDAPVPALPPRPAPRIGGAAEASGARPAPRAPLDEDVVASFPSAPPSSPELDFALDDDDDARTRIAPASSSSVRPVSRAPLDELSSPGDELDLPEPRVPSTPERASDDDDLDEKAPSAPPHADAARAAPSVPPPLPKLPAVPSPARIPGPPVPPPRAIGVPRPGGLPPIPRPNVPRPGGAPVVPRPQLPSIPKPGEAKRPDRLPIPRPAPRPTPAIPTPAAAKAPSREPDIDALAELDLDLSIPPASEPAKSEPPKSTPPEPSPTASDELETAELETAELGAIDATPEDDELDALLEVAEPQPSPTASDELETAELGAIDATPEDDELDALLEAAKPGTSATTDEERDEAVVLAPEHAGADDDLAPIADASADDDGSPIAGASAGEATADEPSAGEPSAEDDDFVVATEDDDFVIDAGGEDDELVVGAEASEDDDWGDEDWDAIEAAEAEQAAKAELDRGALAARRSVRSRKPRDESFPMVGEGAEALRLRQRLLKSLANSREGALRARILVGAAELAEQLGDADEARGLFQSALDADPTDVVALRALRRDATARGAWDELAELFAKEAQLDLTSWERALALTGLAELQLTRRGDPASAERAAARALELEPRSLSARLLLTEARLARGQTAAAMSALAPAAEGWDDPAAQAAVEVELARHAEREGKIERARELYAAAAAHDGGALDALVGLARTACHADPSAAVDALSRIAERAVTPLRDAVLTRASRIATLVAHDAATGVALLEGASGVLPLQARAEAAAATGDREVELAALGAWASAAGGTDRALALVRMAEALAAGGDLEGADAALRDASLADGSLGTIRVVREIIARRAGDFSRLVTAVEAGGALAAAARIAADPSALERERELLQAAASEGNALVAVDVLTLDLAAAQGDDAEVDAALRRQADRTPPERRVGSLLALAERAIERGELEPAEALLTEARTLAPGDPLVLRPLGRLALQRDATVTAALFMEEASVATGERAAYAATEAGRVLMRAEGDAVGALRRALDAVPGYGPAAWLLKPLATELGDPLTLGEVHDQLATSAVDPMDAAAHLVRGALLRADADPESAGGLLAKARGHAPDDAVLQSLVMRSMSGTSPADRASMLVSSAAKASPLLARVFRLQAAAAYEDADEPAAAAAQYRELAKTHPEDPVVRFGLDRAEIAAGEIARVAERRFAAVKEADDDRRVLALERLADLDLHERKDPSSAVLSLSSILETAPGHLPSLRALQRYFAEQGRTEDAANVLETLADHVEEGPDVTAHVRLARRLRLAHPDAPGEAADELLVRTAPRAELDLWLAPRVLAAALARDDRATATSAARRLAELLATANERASARLRAAELVDADDALELLRDASQSAPKHPLAALVLAEACERAERFEDAAEAWEQAARASEVRVHAAALFDRAGRLWETKLQNPECARRAYEQASERDVTFGDLFDRLRAILQAAGDRERLAELYTQRLAAGGDTAQLVELYAKQAELYTDLRDLTNAKAALRAALALMPERIDALRALANICLEDEDWRGAAEVLIRIARIRKEREELRWVFFTLGDIYDQHMPDPRRAEAAFQRVLKLFPQDVPAMERLAVLHEREGQHQAAAEMLTELARLDVDPERNRAHRLKLAATYEQLGDARRAEHVLEEARKNAPTDLLVLRAFADFYQRQNAANAMQMHLSRAVNDYRHALEADLGDAAAWPGLVEVLTWRGDGDAASAAASAAQALGIVDIEMSKLVDPRGSAPGLGAGAALDVLDELLAPASLPAQTRAVFRLAGEALEKSLPFDVAAYRAEKINPRDTQIRPIALEVARWFGIPDPQLYVTSAAPRVCVPVYSNPVTVLVGSELLGITDDREKLFVLVRAFKIAHAQLSVVMRAQPHELAALMGGLVTSYDPHHVPAGADPALVQEAARRIAKNVARKARDELGPLVFEMAGLPGYDPAVFPMAASEWGNRTALVASGSAPAGLSALAKLSGERDLPSDPSARLGMLTRFPEAASLLAFAISDGHFEARRRGGGRR